MIEKKRIEIFPKHMGFFPYMFLVYLLFPIYHLAQVSGWKFVLGSGMLILLLSHTVNFILFRRRLFCGHVYRWCLSIYLLYFIIPS